MTNLFRLFETTVERFGDRIAVEVQRPGGLDRYTYRELHALACERAAALRGAGVGTGDRCAILADNDAHWCAAYLGILAAGAVVVPLDTSYSAAQVRTILRDCGAGVLFTSARTYDVGRDAAAELALVVLDLHATGAGSPPASAPGEPGRPGDASEPAVILYTSGTTADPKGVVLTHANLVAERDAAFAVVKVSEADSVLGVLPLFHSLALLSSLLLPFAVGARVVYLETPSSQELVRALSERRITIFACVPQFFYLIHQRVLGEVATRGRLARLLFRALLAVSFRLRLAGVNAGPLLFARVHSLLGRQMRLFVTGGSRFDPAIGRDLYALGFSIVQAYGLTETSGAVTISAQDEAHLDTVGRPLPGVEVKILPTESPGRPDGEIAIRGPIVMHGYFNRPDATATVMRDGWLLTGDLGRLDAEGRLTITGRSKEVIILANGKNLYPEEIEAHYRRSAFIKEICVTTLAAGDRPSGERLYAVVVPDMDVLRQRKVVNAGDLIRFELEGLGAALPSYKRVLGYEVWFEGLPRTTTGKLKRYEIVKRLQRSAEPGAAATDSGDAPPAPWPETPQVAEALAIVRRLTEGAALRPDSNLELDLGLDSMGRVELVTELEQHFGLRLGDDQAHQIFTLGQLVEAVLRKAATNAGSSETEYSPSRDPSHDQRSLSFPGAALASRSAVLERARPLADDPWTVLLRDLPPATDPVLGGLLAPRPVLEPMLFLASRLIPRVLGTVRVEGLEQLPRHGPFLLCPNHQSYVDPFFVCGLLPYRTFARVFFVGAVEYFETSLMSWVARKIHCVPVDPDSNLVPAMKAGAFGLAHGKVLMLFPEGERSIDGTVKRFKKGAPILSRHLGIPIVPVAIRGAELIWPRAGRFNWRGLLPWSRSRVRVRFGTPLQFTGGESYADAAARLRAVVDAMWRGL